MPDLGHPRVLLLEERAGLADLVAAVLGADAVVAERMTGVTSAVRTALEERSFDLVIAVCSGPGARAGEILELIRDGDHDASCVIVPVVADAATAVEMMRAGAADVVPLDHLTRLGAAIERGLTDVAARVERRGAEATYSGLHDRLTGLMRAARTLALVISDQRGVITDWGEGAERMLGYAAAEVVGTADLTLGHDPEELAARAVELGVATGLEAILADAREGGAILREWSHLRKDGTRFPSARAIAPILDESGRITGFVGLGRDISRRRRDQDEQAALQRVATAVAGDPEPDAIFAQVAEEAATLLDGDMAGVSRFDDRVAVEMGAWSGEAVASIGPGFTSPLDGASAIAVVHATGASARVDDLGAALDDETLGRLGRAPGFRAVVACPVTVAGRQWGALWVGSTRPGVFGSDDEVRLGRFGDLAGLAIANAEARERIVSDAVAGIFRGDLDVEGTLDLIVAAARRAMNADRATCYVHAEGGGAVLSVHTTESDPRMRTYLDAARGRTSARMPIWQMMLANPAPTMVIEDLSHDPAISSSTAKALGAGALVGMRLEHPSVRSEGGLDLLGSLFLAYRRPRRFSARERAAAESLAGMAAVALANARLHADALRHAVEVQTSTTTDPLTGLANHRTFQERLAHEVTRARRHKRSLSLALVDIDHFRRVNEQHGHEAGDSVLSEIAELLRSAARDADLVARVGGEEIAWLMPETEAMEAWQAVDRARETVARAPIAGTGVHITVSAGVCDLAQAGSAGELLRLAEGALYWAKQHGRDVAFLYSPAVVEELSAEERADRLQRVQALQSIRVLARAVDAKDPSTREHSERVADLAVSLATVLKWDPDRLVRLREAGLVHDVGKIGVPDRILFKPARLSPVEYEEITRHAAIGAAMVADVLTTEQISWVRGHHERWDGKGYPDGLADLAIPDGARVLALADAWDVMTSERPYHEPLTIGDALAECRRCAGGQFSVEVVEAIEQMVRAGALSDVPAT